MSGYVERGQRDHSAIQSMSRSLADRRHTRKIIESVFDVSHIEPGVVDLRSESPRHYYISYIVTGWPHPLHTLSSPFIPDPNPTVTVTVTLKLTLRLKLNVSVMYRTL